MDASVRTRFAPSPTGQLHVGGARTAILNWLVARHHGGSFVLRLEDTDTERNVPGAEAAILDDLRWLGLDWDEGPDVGGEFGPYRQSEAASLYRASAEHLLQEGLAYRCTCPPAPASTTEQRRPRCRCAEQSGAAAVGDPGPGSGASVRFRVPDGDPVVVEDRVRGAVTFPRDALEDFVLLRSDGRATYNFAVVVDDARMRITHVLRGSDHLINTPKQVLLYHAFGWSVPEFAHIPLILGDDRQKLSKRHGATSVAEHRRLGYMPEAVVNYLSLLSWSSPEGEEFLPRERLIGELDLDRLGASDAIFDRDKLRWLSSRYLQQLTPDALVGAVRGFVDRDRFPISDEGLPIAVEAVRTKLSVLSDVDDHLDAFVGRLSPERHEARAAALAEPATAAVIAAVRERLQATEPWDEAGINAAIREGGAAVRARGRGLFLPVRLALTGEEHGSELAKIARVFGRERTLALLDGQALLPHTFDVSKG